MAESKQVKVDNWGIFFLQRLQTFFNKTYFCDLTLQFEDNVQLKVHRLVLNACTEYFQVLEQTCDLVNDCLIMPPDLQADVVVPIVNFMYSGILEFQIATFDRLYATARLMNMTVLTKLLDAQKVPISPIPKPMNKRQIAPITWNLQGKKISPKTMDPDLPEQLPGRKLPIWKRKSAPVQTPIEFTRGILQSVADPLTTKYFRPQHDEPPKPTRFDWPEDDAFDTQPFDEISYTSKPILQPTREKSPKPSTSFDEIKRSSVKRVASPVYNDNKKVNIQDVKEYIKEQKIRSDYNDYDDSETADNDLQTYDDDTDDEAQSEETRGILKNDVSPPHNKRVRFSIEGKENSKTDTKTGGGGGGGDVTNHTKIITEVLKKFPQLVQKNKNIRLKILAKGQNANLVSKSSPGTPVKVVKPVSKVSYMVHKPNDTKSSSDKKDQWSCQKCSETSPVIFDTYHAYRSHLTETHNEKTDSQMCNICGHVSRKQNMLMYHKYVKHNIEPPPIFQFPKCQECAYVALSPSLLIKHQYNHTHQNLVCAECHTAFSNKTDLIRHIQTTGHSGSTPITTFDCTQCPKKFISSETLNQHIRNNHKVEEKSPEKNIITVEEIDAMAEQHAEEKPKEKIKILSDIKVNKPIPLKQTEEKQSSEAESLSNVASGIAASLGLVNTIVVLDENNQFILQDGQTSTSQQNFILPDNMNIVSQQDSSKNSIGSTDELVMVLTDHDYSDATNNAVLTSDNSNIVVLYSHPVQGQDGFISQPGNLMLNSNMGLVEVNNFEDKACDESIEMIQQEINSHLEEEIQNKEPKSPEKMDVDVDLTPQNQEPLPGIQTIATNQKYMFIPTTTHDNMREMQENMEEIQENISEMQERITEEEGMTVVQDEMAEIHEEMSVIQPEIQENLADVEENHPGEEENHPGGQENLPDVEENLPGVEENRDVEENLPGVEENLPGGEENHPEVEENHPEVEENHPEVEENLPGVEENLPEVEEILPGEKENLPGGQENLGEVQLGEVQENLDEVQENLSKKQEIQPEVQENMSEGQDNLPEVQENMSERQENLPEVQENMSEGQENLPEMQENMSEEQENQSEVQETPPNAQENLPETPKIPSEDAPTNELIEDRFDEPMEVEESVEMVQQEINRQQLEISENSSSREENETKTASSEPEPIKPSPEIQEEPKETEESIENIEKELQQHQEEFVEQMEVDSAAAKPINDLETEEITSPENFDSTENTDQENENENEDSKEESDLTTTTINQSTDVVDSGIDVNQESETCAEISQLSESESVAQTVDEVSDLPQDSPNEDAEMSKKPFRISLDFQDTEEKEIELQVTKSTTTDATAKICNNKLVLNPVTKSKISNLLDDWDDGDTDSQQSDTNKHVAAKKENSINTLINDWEDEED